MMLSDTQVDNIYNILDLLFNKNEKFCVVSGSAGTGKTTIINDLLSIIQRNIFLSPKVLSFTGKSCEVLTTKGVKAKTLHSVLMEPIMDEFGNYTGFTFKNKKDVENSFNFFIIDECSMVPDDMIEYLMDLNVKIVFFGDHKQLPPIKKSDFDIFDFSDIIMNENFRSDDNIIKLAEDAYNNNMISTKHNFDNVSIHPKNTRLGGLMRDQEFDAILCSKNDTRRYINYLYRRIHGLSEHTITEGEKIISLSNGPALYNGEVMTVGKVEDYGDMVSLKTTSGKVIKTLKWCFDNDIKNDWDFREHMNRHNQNRKSMSEIHPVTYAYGLTVHKSQGSEYDNVLFLDEDLYNVPRNRLRYTAITRAKNNITIIKDFKT